jgi:predicted CopG family antitoxin
MYWSRPMTRKTIRLDMEAYSRLKGAKSKNESFSQAIKRIFRDDISKPTRATKKMP